MKGNHNDFVDAWISALINSQECTIRMFDIRIKKFKNANVFKRIWMAIRKDI